MYRDNYGKRILNPFRVLRHVIRDNNREAQIHMTAGFNNFAKRQDNVVQAVREELHSLRETFLSQLEEILKLQQNNTVGIAELTETLHTLTGKATEITGGNNSRVNISVLAEEYGRELENVAGEIVEDLPRPPRGLTGRG